MLKESKAESSEECLSGSATLLPRAFKASTYSKYEANLLANSGAAAAAEASYATDLNSTSSSDDFLQANASDGSFEAPRNRAKELEEALRKVDMPTLQQNYEGCREAYDAAAAASPFSDPRHPTYLGDWERSIPYIHDGIAQDDVDEPHRKRKLAILKVHPEITKLYGPEWRTKYAIVALVVFDLCTAYYIGRHTSSLLLFLVLSWAVAGSITGIFGVVIHECAHNLAARTPFANRLLGLVANMAYVVPIAASFKRYHLDHHAYQGVDVIDADLPLAIEMKLIRGNKFLKFLWVFFFPFFYLFRGLAMCNLPQKWEVINLVWTLVCDAFYLYFFGLRGFLFLFCGLWFGYGIHPFAAHFIQEHYTFVDGQETYSYYGILNIPMMNIGYHNEHHDFMSVPWSRLPDVRKIAPEFYNTIAYHTSWVRVIYDFIMRDDVGPQSRVGRTYQDHQRGRKMISDAATTNAASKKLD